MILTVILLLFYICSQPVYADDFLLNSDGTVADLTSGLIWQGSSVEAQTSLDAISYCQNTSSTDSHNWRLPSRSELVNLEVQLQTLSLASYWVVNISEAEHGIYCLGDGAFFAEVMVKKSALVRCVADNPLAPIVGALRNWVDSWQNKDVDGYLAAYEHNFRPGNGLDHEVWMQKRRYRLESAQEISINLKTEKVRLLSEHLAEVIVVQSYRSKHYRDRVKKRFLLRKQRGRWLIAKEDQLSNLPYKAYSSATVY